jgi:hypothetical protein
LSTKTGAGQSCTFKQAWMNISIFLIPLIPTKAYYFSLLWLVIIFLSLFHAWSQATFSSYVHTWSDFSWLPSMSETRMRFHLTKFWKYLQVKNLYRTFKSQFMQVSSNILHKERLYHCLKNEWKLYGILQKDIHRYI